MKASERHQPPVLPTHAIIECKCVVCGMVKDFKNSEVDPRYGPVCPTCHGPMVVQKVKGR
jgi:hypothetical protein